MDSLAEAPKDTPSLRTTSISQEIVMKASSRNIQSFLSTALEGNLSIRKERPAIFRRERGRRKSGAMPLPAAPAGGKGAIRRASPAKAGIGQGYRGGGGGGRRLPSLPESREARRMPKGRRGKRVERSPSRQRLRRGSKGKLRERPPRRLPLRRRPTRPSGEITAGAAPRTGSKGSYLRHPVRGMLYIGRKWCYI